MAERLTKFLIELSTDPTKKHQFEINPDAVMESAGLTSGERELLLAKDPALVRAWYGVETLAHMTTDPDDLKKKANQIEKLTADIKKLATKLKDEQKKEQKKNAKKKKK
jgi:hypothetical protein